MSSFFMGRGYSNWNVKLSELRPGRGDQTVATGEAPPVLRQAEPVVAVTPHLNPPRRGGRIVRSLTALLKATLLSPLPGRFRIRDVYHGLRSPVNGLRSTRGYILIAPSGRCSPYRLAVPRV